MRDQGANSKGQDPGSQKHRWNKDVIEIGDEYEGKIGGAEW